MPMRTRGAAFLASVSFLLWQTLEAAPILNFPVNSQVPPVGRLWEEFNFTIAKSTFIGSEDAIDYSLLHEPSWLHFDNATRTFFGKVPGDQAGPTKFELIASDSAGSTHHGVTFIVTAQSGPHKGEAILPQLGKVGPTSAPASLFLYPLKPFSITFTPDTFSNTTDDTAFYATSADNSPLPSWLQFDAFNLGFSGTSPPLVSPTAKPQAYGVRLIASNIAGFGEAEITFQIVVGYQILAFSKTSHTIEVIPGQAFESEPLRKDLMLDGSSVDDTELTSVTSNAPAWAELDTEQISLSGTPPRGVTSQSVLVEVADTHGDTANATISLVVSRSLIKLFVRDLAPVTTTSGQEFRYTIDQATLSTKDVQVTANLNNASSWLTYDATTKTFSGHVPETLEAGPILIAVNATLGPITERALLVVNVLENVLETTTSTPSAQSSRKVPSATNHPNANASTIKDNAPRHRNRRWVILLAVLLPTLSLLCLGILLWYYCYRRRPRNPRHSPGVSQEYISRPIIPLETEQATTFISQDISDIEKNQTPTSPPRIELPWAPDSFRKSKARRSKNMTNRESTLVDSGWGDFVIRDPPVPARSSRRQERSSPNVIGQAGDWTPFVRQSSQNLNYSRKRTPFRSTQGRVQRASLSSRASKTLSGLSELTVGSPGRLSGAGHGAGGPALMGLRDMRRSWRHGVDSILSEDNRTGPFDLEDFPDPPKCQKETQGRQRRPRVKSSLRLVPSSSSISGSLAEQRQKWVRDRARDRVERGSRFSNAWPSKAYSGVKGLNSSMRSSSRAKTGSFDTDDLLNRQHGAGTWSQSSSIGAPARPDTLLTMKSPDSQVVQQCWNSRPALSTVSSGRFDSAESKSNSSWVDDLIEEEDSHGRRRWVAVDSPVHEHVEGASPALREGGESEQSSWGRSSRMGGLAALRANIQGVGPATPAGERKWRLGGEQAKRPVSVDEGELRRCQGSQRGNLAFV
jgi:axial budding pattern protein 2